MNLESVNKVLGWVISTSILLFFNQSAQANETLKGRVSAVYGTVEIIGQSGRVKVSVGQDVSESDKIETAGGGMVQVRFTDGSSFTVYEKSSIIVETYRRTSQAQSTIESAIDIAYGKLRFFVNPEGREKKNAKFKTKTSIMGIRGTSGIIDASDGKQTQLIVLTGNVQVSNPKFPSVPVMVGANSLTKVTASAAPLPPTPASDVLKTGLLPPVPEAAGFTDDSAAASRAAPSVVPENKSSNSKATEENSKEKPRGESEKTIDENSAKPQEQRNEGTKEQEKERKSGGKPSEKSTGLGQDKKPQSDQKTGGSPKPQQTPIDDKTQPQSNQTRSGKILFSPGGEIVKQDPSKSFNPNEVRLGTNKNTETNPSQNERLSDTNSLPQSNVKVEAVSQPNVMRQVDRTTSQIKSTVESVDKKVQTTIQSNSASSGNKIRVKVKLPRD